MKTTLNVDDTCGHDAETAILMREHGIRRICARDTDFARFPFVEIVDPLAHEP